MAFSEIEMQSGVLRGLSWASPCEHTLVIGERHLDSETLGLPGDITYLFFGRHLPAWFTGAREDEALLSQSPLDRLGDDDVPSGQEWPPLVWDAGVDDDGMT